MRGKKENRVEFPVRPIHRRAQMETGFKSICYWLSLLPARTKNSIPDKASRLPPRECLPCAHVCTHQHPWSIPRELTSRLGAMLSPSVEHYQWLGLLRLTHATTSPEKFLPPPSTRFRIPLEEAAISVTSTPIPLHCIRPLWCPSWVVV